MREKIVKHVEFYSGTYRGQNKQSNVIATFMADVLKYNPNIETIVHKFLVCEHTYGMRFRSFHHCEKK